MMNPASIYDYEPLDRTKLTLPAKIFVNILEYFARVLGALYLSLSLLVVSIIPGRKPTKTFFRMIGNVADMYRSRHMRDEYDNNKTVEKGNEQEVSGMEKKK